VPPPESETPLVAARPVEPTEDYLLGPRDLLTLRVLELERPGDVSVIDLEVGPRGEVVVPFVGFVQAAGKTVLELRAAIAVALDQRALVDPQVMLSMKEYRSKPITVVGPVAKPGLTYLNQNRMSLLDAISLAGGLSNDAGTKVLVTPAGSTTPTTIDLVALTRGDLPSNVVVEPGAVVKVMAAEDIYVLGYVTRPGAVPFKRPIGVQEAIALAGGIDPRNGSPSEVIIHRPTSEGMRLIPVDVDQIAAGETPNVPVQAGDTVEVGRTFLRAFYVEVILGFSNRVGIGAGYSLGGLK
jgi:polysaccharide export outer membrane protein